MSNLILADALGTIYHQPAPASALPPAPAFETLGAEPLNLLQRYKTNTVGRDFVVGDLRGCTELLDELLAEIGFNKRVDRLFATGNVVGDAGKNKAAVIELLRQPWFKTVGGNREEILMREWVAAGSPGNVVEVIDLIADLPLVIVVGEGSTKFQVIHGEFLGPDEALEDILENATTHSTLPLSLTWGRDLIDGKVDASVQEGLSPTFSGHVPVLQVSALGSQIYIDTGAGLPDRAGEANGLTIVEPKTAEIWRSKASAHA